MKRILTLALFMAFAICLRAQEPLEFSRTFLMPGQSAREIFHKAKIWTQSVEWNAPFSGAAIDCKDGNYTWSILTKVDDGMRDFWWFLSGYDNVILHCNIDCYSGKYVVRFTDITSYTGTLYGSDGVLDPNQFYKPRVYRRMSKIVDHLVPFFDSVCEDVAKVMDTPPEGSQTL